MQDVHDLPNDIESLKRLVLEQQAILNSRDTEIEPLRLLLARLRRQKFGRSSEALDQQITQLELTLEELETRQAANPQPVAAVSPERTQPVRRPLPEQLPREEVVHAALPADQNCACPESGGAMHVIGEDVSEVLERIPSRFKVIRHVRPKLACGECQKIVQAPAPSRPIERGVAGPSMLAHVLVSKYC